MTLFSLVVAAVNGGILNSQVQDPRIDLQIAFPVMTVQPSPPEHEAPQLTISSNSVNTGSDLGLRPQIELPTAPVSISAPFGEVQSTSTSVQSHGNANTVAPAYTFSYQIPALIGSSALSKEEQKKVSVNFSSASVHEVFNWLKKQNVSFIVEDGRIDEKTKVTLNANNIPIGTLVDAIASSLGGHWENQGGIRIYQKGRSFMVSSGMSTLSPTTSQSFSRAFGTTPNTRSLRVLPDASGKVQMPNLNQTRTFNIGAIDFKKLLDSITAEQKEKQKKQGYLKLSDLTESQRKMLGKIEGSISIHYKSDSQELTIKSE